MEASQNIAEARGESPDPSSHALNIYDPETIEDEWVDEEEDDDMDFEPPADESDDSEHSMPEETEEVEFQDAEDGLSGIEIEFTVNDEEESPLSNGEGDETETGIPRLNPTTTHVPEGRIRVSPAQMMQLLGHAGLQRLFTNHRSAESGVLDVDDDDDYLDDGYGGIGTRRRRRIKGANAKLPPVPNEEGKNLMDAGSFGTTHHCRHITGKRKTRLARSLMSRELGVDRGSPMRISKLMSQGLIPSSNADTIIHYDKRCYSGQFSDDGNFFFSCAQDFKVRMYDTSNPYKWKYYKTVVYPYGQWTITDASLSRDNRYLAYSSIRNLVCLSPTDPNDQSEPLQLDFSDMGQRNHRRQHQSGYTYFFIFSIRFSGDGREIVGGSSDHSVYVHDIETQKSTLRISGHNNDVNAVCFGDASSPHILYSGSDDTLIKVWDRRSMGDSREAGVFMGHTEGVTYVDSKGDGRYVLSNGKDHSMKLWDLRKMMSTDKASKLDPNQYSKGLDYRYQAYSENHYRQHPHDCSIVTFRGHRVLQTLIRCHFSPLGSTDSRFVYTGSADGSVYIYNLDATLAGKIDVTKATYHSRPRDPDLHTGTYDLGDHLGGGSWKTCVRDASWHPNAPIIAATSWNGWGMSTGTCTTHSWNDGADEDEASPKMGLRVNERLEHDEALYENFGQKPRRSSQFRTRLRSQRVAAASGNDEGESW